MLSTRALSLTMNSIFVVVFNVVFFTLTGTVHPTSAWISYGFIHFAYFMLLATPLWITKGTSAAVFGFSLKSISSTYFVAELILGVTFILRSPESYKAALLLQLCMAGLFGILLMSHIIANEHTAECEKMRRYDIDYVKRAAAEVASIKRGMSNGDAKRKVERVYDAISTSPTKSLPELSSVEAHLLLTIADLRCAVTSNDTAAIAAKSDVLLTMVDERNQRLKLRR